MAKAKEVVASGKADEEMPEDALDPGLRQKLAEKEAMLKSRSNSQEATSNLEKEVQQSKEKAGENMTDIEAKLRAELANREKEKADS